MTEQIQIIWCRLECSSSYLKVLWVAQKVFSMYLGANRLWVPLGPQLRWTSLFLNDILLPASETFYQHFEKQKTSLTDGWFFKTKFDLASWEKTWCKHSLPPSPPPPPTHPPNPTKERGRGCQGFIKRILDNGK